MLHPRAGWLFLAIALCAATFALIPKPGAAATKHAYLSGANDPGVEFDFDARTVAYAVTGGRLAPHPDRIYQNTAGPIVLDPQGRLYASQFGCKIAVYAPNSTRIERTLELNPTDCGSSYYYYWDITALAVDHAGYVFVSLALYAGSAHPRGGQVHKNSASGYGCSGSYYFACTLVYAPGSSGPVVPLHQIGFSYSLAVDGAGDLYVQNKTNEIDVFAHAATNPTLVRKIVPEGLHNASNPVVNDGLLYVQVQKCPDGPENPCEPGVAVFPQSANGVVKPQRLFTLPVSATWWNIAVSDAALYAGAGGPTIESFHKTATGIVVPLFTSFLYPVPTFPQYLEFGP